MSSEIGLATNFLEIGKQEANPNHHTPVLIELLRPNSIVMVGAWNNSLDLVETKIKSVCDIKPESSPGRCSTTEDTIIACLTPGQFLFISEVEDLFGKLNDLMMPNASTVLDLRHSRIGYRVSGTLAKMVLAKGLAVDTTDANFPDLSAIQTTIDHVSSLVIRRKTDMFDIYVPSSFAQSFAHWLTDASLEYGYTVGNYAKISTN